MTRRVPLRPQLATALLLACSTVLPATAAEHITLRNGFVLTCDHRGPTATDPDHQASSHEVRLYLDALESNYLDVAPEEILSTEPFTTAPSAETPGSAAIATHTVASSAATPQKTTLTPAELHELLSTAGTQHDLDVDLLASLVHAESAGHPSAVSRTGAQGLMQLMPATAAQLGVRPGIDSAFDPGTNVHAGTAYLDTLLHRYHDNLALALAAYNAGPAAVDRYHGIPPYRETRAYVARIIHEFNHRYAARQAALNQETTAALATSIAHNR